MKVNCPICSADLSRLAFADDQILALWNGEDRASADLLLAPRRHLQHWRELSAAERAALTARIEDCHLLMEEHHGSNQLDTNFNEQEPHFQIIVRGRPAARTDLTADNKDHRPSEITADTTKSDGSAIGQVPHKRALIVGEDDALLRHLVPHIDQAKQVDAAISFVLGSGVRHLFPHLQDMLNRGGRLRLLAGDYLDVTDPDALRRLLDLSGERDLRIFRAEHTAFHLKSWIFRFTDGMGATIVGSSNLSENALLLGVEWNLRLFSNASVGPLQQATAEFEALLSRPEVTPLTETWIDSYERRRARPDRPLPVVTGVEDEEPELPPEPHEIQQNALKALAETRTAGYQAGLVVLATGLGKTFLAAFDSCPFARVLFVAHREEILDQATAAFRRVRPHARIGRFAGTEKDRDADLLFASVQTLGRATHLSSFPTDAFDYIVIDEFHHAAARTYRQLIDHFEPRFLLGLTATPERADGGDLLALCQENLVYRCDLWDGIGRHLLVPFSYFGVPDIVEYAQIPWRSGRFDEEELTTAVATRARAQNALDQLRQRGGERAIGFCVSRRHADFMSEFFLKQGLRSVAVHSGETSAPRSSSLQALAAGELDIIFAVDMFNEGVDIPEIDTVLMLRPTESPVIWLQQFGRGLRKADGKDRLSVIDYIGNHRIFLTKARTLLQVGEGERALAQRLAEIRRGEVGLPEGCEITYDLEAIDILERLIRKTDEGDELEAFYRDFRDRHGVRPTALETYHAGFDPRRTGHGGWFGFVSDQGDLNEAERAAYNDHSGFLECLETTEMTRSYKMLVLRAMIEEDAFPGAVEIDRLVNRFAHLTARNPRLRSDVSADLENMPAVKRLLEKYPLTAWAEVDGGRWFTWDGSVFSTRFRTGERTHKPLIEMTSEIVDWRLARHLDVPKEQPRPEPAPGLNESPASFDHPELWREYKRDEVPALFGATFNPAAWNSGIVTLENDMVLLVTLKKGSLSSGNEYEDRFEDPLTFHWQSQNQTRQASKHGRIINGTEPGWHVHLFVRSSKLRNGKAAPFRYCGILQFIEWEGEKPISVRWRLQQRVPDNLHRIFGIV